MIELLYAREHLEDLAQQLSGLPPWTNDEWRAWLAGCMDEQLNAMVGRLPALSKDEQARGRVIRNGCDWRIGVDDRVIRSSDEELPAYQARRRAPRSPG